MIKLPNECYYPIFNNLQDNYKNLLSCALVNRQWCRIIIPILWSKAKNHLNDIRLIKIFLLMLNTKERALLIPFNIALPSHPIPLFEYSSYITSINDNLDYGITGWLRYNKYETRRVKNVVKFSLISMFLRTNKNLKSLNLNSNYYQFGSERVNTLLEALYDNTALNTLDLHNNKIDIEGGRIIAKFLCKNTTLIHLDLSSNNLGSEGGEALANALCKNTMLTFLYFHDNNIGSKGGKALANGFARITG
ncbi:RNI-like protein [Gigaspora margarita]|uniref:RNI-like protein n=1 Tax=Gigaspora margarita TaxID=4874 RepID=A0A8H4A5N1_GIGMA|nr:RNI-like protein [Gigaspora margarita]KAF0429117.1 RNI-like protein [Gigaspora margarita]